MKDQELKEILDPTFQDNFKGETLDELEAEKAVLSKLRYKIGFKIGYTQGILNVYPKFFSKITGESFDLAYKLMICKLLEINVRAIPLSLDDGSSGLNVIM